MDYSKKWLWASVGAAFLLNVHQGAATDQKDTPLDDSVPVIAVHTMLAGTTGTNSTLAIRQMLVPLGQALPEKSLSILSLTKVDFNP